VLVTSNPEDVRKATKLILPGVGAFGDGMRNLREFDLAEPFIEKVEGRYTPRWYLPRHASSSSRSEEFGHHPGPEPSAGTRRETAGKSARASHGLNQLHPKQANGFTKGLAESSFVYFVHSYYAKPTSDGHRFATTDYEIEFPAIVHTKNIWATQFHPEKSQHVGERFSTTLHDYEDLSGNRYPRGKRCASTGPQA
jgi:glutamine amidotransferase